MKPGSRLGHFVVLAPVGSGAMGEVFRARDERPYCPALFPSDPRVHEVVKSYLP